MRIHLTSSLTIATILGLTGGFAYYATARPRAQPVKKRAGIVKKKGGKRGRRTKHNCGPKPSKAKCQQEFYLEDCRADWGSHCKTLFEQPYENHWNGLKSPVIPLLKPKKTRIPQDINPKGKVEQYPGPETKSDLVGTFPTIKTTKSGPAAAGKTTHKKFGKKAVRPRTNTSTLSKMGSSRGKTLKLTKVKKRKAGLVNVSDNIFSRTGLTRPPHSGTGGLPKRAHRKPAWDDNGQKVTSCEEYGYEMVYDWGRYTDSMAACAGDQVCQLDIAFLPSTPGIKNRTLRRKDGVPLKPQINKASRKNALPKNDLFAAGKKFARAAAGGRLEMTPDLKALEDALEQGEEYYVLGSRSYANEWDWHEKLFNRNRTVPKSHFDEYERRKAKFRNLMQQWWYAAKKEEAKLKGAGFSKKHKYVTPLDMVGNPLERMNRMKTRTQKLTKSAKRLGKVKKAGRAGRAKKGLTPKTRPSPKAQPTPKNKATPAPKAQPAPAPKAQPAPAPKAQPAPTNKGARPVNKGGKVNKGGLSPINKGGIGAIQPTTMMGFVPKKPNPGVSPSANRGAKTKTAATSCLKANFSKISELHGQGPISCQIGKFLRGEWRRKKRGEKSCLDLDNDDCDWSPEMFEERFVEGVPYLDEQAKHEEFCMAWTGGNISQPNLHAATQHIQARKADIEKKMKELQPYLKPGGGKKGFAEAWTDGDHFGDKGMFAAGYDYNLGFDVQAWEKSPGPACQVGGKAGGYFTLDAWFVKEHISIVDARAEAEYNTKNLGYQNGDRKIWFKVFGHNYLPDDLTGPFKGAFDLPLFNEDIDIPSGYRPSFYTMAGPIPISGSVWGEFFMGANLAIDVVSKSESCDMNQLQFGVTGEVVPEVGLNAKAQVGVGIAGLLSAGIRGMVNLVTIGVPVKADLNTKIVNGEATFNFGLDLQLALSTLSGWLAVYVEFLIFEEEFELFRWNGVGPHKISLLGEPLSVEIPLFVIAD